MSTFLSQLNGWRRLWIVFAIICFILATAVAVVGQRVVNAVEDEAILAKLNADDITRVLVLLPSRPIQREGPWTKYQRERRILFNVPSTDSLLARIRSRYSQYDNLTDSALATAIHNRYPITTTLEFPKDLDEIAIRDVINRYDDPDTLRLVAANLIADRNKRQAAQAKTGNDEVRAANLRLFVSVYAACFILVVAIYLLGYAIAWIVRGFKNS